MQKVVIILPTYNEREVIEQALTDVLRNVEEIRDFDIELLVVDSASPDGTGEIVKEFQKTNSRINLLTVNERGLGLALVRGYRHAFEVLGADIVLQMDSDLQHNPADIKNLLLPFKTGAEFVQGSRFIKGGGNDLEAHRKFLSWAANLTARILFGALKVHEFTTSFRAFKRIVWERIDFSKVPHRGKSFIFQPAFLNAVLESGTKVQEVPIIFTDRRKGYSKMDMISYSFELIKYGLTVQVGRREKFLKFCVVGTSGAVVQSLIYGLFKSQIHPSLAIMMGAELAIINGFIWNNAWTFHDRKLSGNKVVKFLQYNLGSLGSLLIQGVTVGIGVAVFGRSQFVDWFFACLGIGIGLIWNFFFYSRVIWQKK